MQSKRYLILLFAIGFFVLGACNLPAASATPDSGALQMILTEAAASAPAPSAAPTVTAIQPTPTVTLFYESTATLAIVQRTPTLTLFYAPSPTATPSWMDCPLIITKTDTDKGDMLHILRCEDKLEYDLGPFAKGVYAAGPNNQFIVYVANSGMVYAAKMGDQVLSVIVNLAKERFFTAVNKNALPKFEISFIGEAPNYKLVLIEKKYKQQKIYNLPMRVTK